MWVLKDVRNTGCHPEMTYGGDGGMLLILRGCVSGVRWQRMQLAVSETDEFQGLLCPRDLRYPLVRM